MALSQSTRMLSGIRDVLVISTPEDIGGYERLLGDGGKIGLNISYAVQPLPEGLAQAFLIGRDFIGTDRVSLALGDNVFYGHGLPDTLRSAAVREHGATVFGYWVRDPERYGVIEFAPDGKVLGIEEKPAEPRSHFAVVGIYFYDNSVLDIAAGLKPSSRGELEITDVNKWYLEQGTLQVELLGRGLAWLDTGTHQSLLQAQTFVEAIQERQGLKVACLEEIAYHQGWISREDLQEMAAAMGKSGYGDYLRVIAGENP